MPVLQFPIRVYIEDTDAGGIVYYVNYLKYMERVRSEYLRNLGFGKAALFSSERMFVVHSLQCNYLASAELDDELVVTAGVKKVGRVAVVFEQQVLRGNTLLCKGEVKVACVECVNRKPVAMPDEIFKKFHEAI